MKLPSDGKTSPFLSHPTTPPVNQSSYTSGGRDGRSARKSIVMVSRDEIKEIKKMDMGVFASDSVVDRVTPKNYIGQLMADVEKIDEADSELENDL